MIRAATRSDAMDICAIWNPIIRDSVATFTTQEKNPDHIANDIQHCNGAFWVAEQDSQTIGFATYFPFRGGPGYAYTKEHSIMLTDQARGQGHGRALMQQIIAHAQTNGIHSLIAGISAENGAAIGFHTANGFDQIARLPEVGYKFGRWMDLVLMQKRL